jgi:hypothetical protein
MAWVQADLEKLDAAIASGGVLQSMTFGDQTFSFRSIDEMLKLRSVMTQSVNSRTGGHRLAATGKGA